MEEGEIVTEEEKEKIDGGEEEYENTGENGDEEHTVVETTDEDTGEGEEKGKEIVEEETAPSRFRLMAKKGIIEDLLKPVAALSEEAKMEVNADGIDIRVVDAANVCMVSISLKKEGADEYSSDAGTIGLPVKEILRLINNVGKTDDLSLEYLPEMNRIRMTSGRLQYGLGVISLNIIKKAPKVPMIDVPVKMIMDGKEFRRVVASAEKISDYIQFSGDGLGVTIESISDTTDMSSRIQKEDMIEFYTTSEKIESSSFSLDYMGNISKVMADKGNVEMWIGTDYPCRVEATFADGNGTIKYLLAPRVED